MLCSLMTDEIMSDRIMNPKNSTMLQETAHIFIRCVGCITCLDWLWRDALQNSLRIRLSVMNRHMSAPIISNELYTVRPTEFVDTAILGGSFEK